MTYSLPFDHDSFRYQALRKYVLCNATHSLLTGLHRSTLMKSIYVSRSSSIARSSGCLERVSVRVFLLRFKLVDGFSPLKIIRAEARWCTRGDKLRITIQRGLISLPRDPQTPVICVGPGTGVAPMRAVIEDRIHTGSEGESH